MSRSAYVYVVSYAARVGVSAPILARTVKYELVRAMGHFPAAMLADVEVWRCRDEGATYGGPDSRDFLGTGPDFLAEHAASGVSA